MIQLSYSWDQVYLTCTEAVTFFSKNLRSECFQSTFLSFLINFSVIKYLFSSLQSLDLFSSLSPMMQIIIKKQTHPVHGRVFSIISSGTYRNTMWGKFFFRNMWNPINANKALLLKLIEVKTKESTCCFFL